MLVLTRRRDEAIMIGDSIEITVLRVGHDGVRIGIRAPQDIAVHRREIYEQIRAQNRAAARALGSAQSLADRVRQLTGPSDAHATCPSNHR